MNRTHRTALKSIFLVTVLVLLQIILNRFSFRPISPETVSQRPDTAAVKKDRVTFLAFGDMNLGRWLGQRILKGEVNYPFEHFNVRQFGADIVFANLESPISDQKGETGDKKNNLIFTGPPQGTKTIKNAGITIVSTANNHALDYREKALFETIDRLTEEGISFVGTSRTKENIYKPLIFEKNNIKFAIFAVTDFMNFTPKNWKNIVAHADTVQLRSEIVKVRNLVDVIIVSYHGGVEYLDRPIGKVKKFTQWCINNQVDVVIGHHPHVTFGIEKYKGKYIIHSLGNFVFYQPQHYWTQRSYGVLFSFEKNAQKLAINIEKIIPLSVGFQTQKLVDSTESLRLLNRTQLLSNFDLSLVWE